MLDSFCDTYLVKLFFSLNKKSVLPVADAGCMETIGKLKIVLWTFISQNAGEFRFSKKTWRRKRAF